MEEVNGEHWTWKQELASLVEFPGTMDFGESASGDRFHSPISVAGPTAREVGEAIREFARGLGEMSMELVKSFGDVLKQSFGDEESFVMRKLGKPCGALFNQLTRYITYWRQNYLYKKGTRVKLLRKCTAHVLYQMLNVQILQECMGTM